MNIKQAREAMKRQPQRDWLGVEDDFLSAMAVLAWFEASKESLKKNLPKYPAE